jgi:hypothetical protein
MNNRSGIEFLTKIYNNLHNEEIVKHTSNPSDNKYQAIEKYMDRLERITERAYQNENDIDLLKRLYHDKYVIKEENIPESYFEKQKQIALDRGYGHLEYTDDIKEREIEQIVNEQKESLDSWLDYFASSDTKHYPTWFKYYCFQSVVKLGYYDKGSNKFTKRTDSTVKPFIEINREALAFMYDAFVKALDKKDLDDKDLEKLINNGSFAKIYSYAIKKMDSVIKDNTNSNEGIWKKYNQGSDPNILFNDIHGKGTGWCTAGGLETATSHINGGDFYVYYTKDRDGEYTAPRIAIRTNYGKIAEIRGVAESQNLESNMEKVVDKKLDEFPDRELYKKKVHDMEMLTFIYTKWKNGRDLLREDLRFLYQIDENIIGFGYSEDPRIEEILQKRSDIKDLSFIFNCKRKRISFTKKRALNNNIICHYGNLDLWDINSANGLSLPEIVIGNLNLGGLTSAEGLKLPEIIGGNLFLRYLTSAEGLKIPETMRGALNLEGLTSAKGLKLPERILGSLYLGGLTSAEDLKLPEMIGGTLGLTDLTSAEGLELPETIGENLDLRGLTSAKGLKLPKTVGRNLDLSGLTSAEGLELPETVGGNLYLSGLTSAKGLKLPKTVGRNLDLRGLTSAEGLKLPERVLDSLYLDSLTSAEGLKLPEIIKGSLDLRSLTSLEDLKLPERIGGTLYLRDLNIVNDEIIHSELDCIISTPSEWTTIRNLRRKVNENSKVKTIA